MSISIVKLWLIRKALRIACTVRSDAREKQKIRTDEKARSKGIQQTETFGELTSSQQRSTVSMCITRNLRKRARVDLAYVRVVFPREI